MNLGELRTLRGQVVLTLLMFAGSLVLALGVVANRWWFERFLFEKYAAHPNSLSAAARQVIDGANRGQADRAAYAKLLPPEQIALFELWMQDAESPSPLAPKALVELDDELYLRRAEQSVVCGSPDQRQRALRFLLSTQSPKCGPILDRLAAWSQSRNRPDWFAAIDQARTEFAGTEKPNRGS